MFRVGFGYDVHQLVPNRKLSLGGIEIPFEKGTLGHSDGDALIHAICDALLGALALGDIGKHFPDTSAEFKDIDSKILLKRTVDLIRSKGWDIGNIDTTVCLEKPKLKDHIPAMEETLAAVLGISLDQISVKATTTEKMGFVGTGEGVAVYAVAGIVNRK
jgi:2-C-methyl-D-erythritol 2,4-cyclodiphosphate synthase